MKNVKKCVMVRYDPAEYKNLVQRANDYQYPSLCSYVKDMSLNHYVYIEYLADKDRICEYFEKMRSELINQEKVVRDKIFNLVNGDIKKEELESLINDMVEQRKQIEQTMRDLIKTQYSVYQV